ncbi:MAG: hypothetical protein WCK77_02870 [Verrucomicrobiota bacterium]
MRRGVIVAAVLMLAGVCLQLAVWTATSAGKTPRFFSWINGQASGTAGEYAGAARYTGKIKAAERPPVGPRGSHSPQQLREFFLPEVSIDGLGLEAALAKLRAAYEDVCRATGETPLHLSFIIPAGADARLRLKIGSRPLDSSIRLLAAASRLTVRRSGAEYRFAVPGELGRKPLSDTLAVPPGFGESLAALAATETSSSGGLLGALAAMGVELDPSTRLSMRPGGLLIDSTSDADPFTARTRRDFCGLVIDSTSAADRGALAALIEAMDSVPLVQHALTAKVIDIPAGVQWSPPQASELGPAELQSLLGELAQTEGVELMAMPSITARSGQAATIEISHEIIAPDADAPDELSAHPVGIVVGVQLAALGLGHQVDLNYTETTGGIDPATGWADITERTAIASKGFVGDAATQVQVQTHPDGSRTLLLVTPVLTDRSGKVFRPRQ